MTKPAEGQAPEGNEGSQVQEGGAPDPWAAFPPEFNWVRKELEDVRKDAAAKRVENKDLKEKLADAKTPEDVLKIVEESNGRVAEAELKTARALAARDAKLPAELDVFITGTTPEEIEAQVKTLAEFHPAKKGDEDPLITPPRPRAVNAAGTDEGRSGHDEYEQWKKNRR